MPLSHTEHDYHVILSEKLKIFSYQSVLTYNWGAKKNHMGESFQDFEADFP